ncbi:MAG: DUF4258 domain-containing protein [bacterium]|nr:DUF4258 domain-containing protein [bacterium]
MKKTKHFGIRMSQRGVTREMVDFVLELGGQDGDMISLSKKELEGLKAELDRREKAYRQRGLDSQTRELGLKKRVTMKLLDKGGLVVVTEGGHLITTYHYGNGRKH